MGGFDHLEFLDRPVERPPHPAMLDDDVLLGDCSIERGRVGGPGGQRRNKVETAVALTHAPTALTAQASERRSVVENKRVALRRLRLRLATEHRVALPAGDVRTTLWRERTRSGRIVCNPSHRDYPSLLAEALDIIVDAAFDLQTAAKRLEVSATQLTKLLREHPPALRLVNEHRASGGQRPLR
ncbi:MAG: peptide chain release factor-like protein [Planctomycetota bacterium]